jgi:hypothetical protein
MHPWISEQLVRETERGRRQAADRARLLRLLPRGRLSILGRLCTATLGRGAPRVAEPIEVASPGATIRMDHDTVIIEMREEVPASVSGELTSGR